MAGKNLLFIFLILGLQPVLADSFDDGVRYLGANRYRDAVQAFKNAIEEDKRAADSWYYLGYILMMSGEFEPAYQNYLKALSTGSRMEVIGEGMDRVMLELQKNLPSDQLQALQEEALKREIYTAPAVYYRLVQLRTEENWQASIELMNTAMASETFKVGTRFLKTYLANAHFLASAAYSRLNDTTNAMEQARIALGYDANLQPAREAYERLSAQARKRYRYQSDLARQAMSAADYVKARTHWEKAMQEMPGESEAIRGVEVARMAQASQEAQQRGEALLRDGKLEKAIQELTFAVNAYADNFAARNLLSDAQKRLLEKMNLQSQRKEEAENREQGFIQALSQAQNALRHKRFDEALALFQRSLELEPSHADAKKGLEEARYQLELETRLNEADRMVSEQKYEMALKTIEELEKSGYSSNHLTELKAPTLFALKKYEELLSLARGVTSYQPQNTQYLYYIAISSNNLFEAGRMPDGFEVYEETLKKIQSLDASFIDVNTRIWKIRQQRWAPILGILLFLGLILSILIWHFKTRDGRRKQKFLDQVEDALKKNNWTRLKSLYDEYLAIELDARETMRLLPTFALALVEMEEFDEAQKVCAKILGAMPEHRQTRIQNARALFGRGFFPQNALKHFRELLDSEYRTEENTRFAGEQVVEQEFRGEDAIPILKHYLALDSSPTKARQMLLGMVHREKRMDKQVVELMLLEIQHSPKDVRLRLKLAEHFLEKGDTEECIRLCEEVINLDVTDKKLHKILMDAYKAQNNLSSLKPIYDSLIQTYPNSIVIQEASAKLGILLSGRN